MGDFQDITNLFAKDVQLPQYAHKRWVKINPVQAQFADNGNGITSAIQYNCRNIADKLVAYADGFIVLNVTCSRAALVAADSAPKGAHAFINQCVIRVNNSEIDNSRYNFISVAIQNSLEYSNDYARVAEQYMFSKDLSGTDADNTGHATRKAFMPTPVANTNTFTFTIKVPLKYLSTFFRTLDFPLINQQVEFDVTYRLTNAIMRDNGAAIIVAINSAVLYVPVVELGRSEEEKLLKLLSSSVKKDLVWNKLVLRDFGAQNGAQDREIAPSIDGVRKLYCVAVPAARWESQEHIESTSDTTITGLNIIIDSEDIFASDVSDSELAYQLVSENFNMGGKDYNTGAMLNYKDFSTVHRYYVFDLSRQKVFESDPRKSQSIRFRGTLSANSRFIVFLAQEKRTTFDFVDPSNTKTI